MEKAKMEQNEKAKQRAKDKFAIYEQMLNQCGNWVMTLDSDENVNQELIRLVQEAGYDYDIIKPLHRSQLEQLAVYY